MKYGVQNPGGKPFLVMEGPDARSVPTSISGQDWAVRRAKKLADMPCSIRVIASRMGSYNELIEVSE